MKVFMPLYSIQAWGRFYGKFPFGSFYGDAARQYGYCIYQRRHVWHGIICIKERYYKPSGEPSSLQLGYRGIFADAVSSWQNLSPVDKKRFKEYAYPIQMSGYNRFLRYYLRDHLYEGYPSMYIWATFIFTISGALVVGADKAPTLAPATNITIDKVWIYSKTAPSGGVCTIDVNKNGTTIFTDQGKRPSIADGQNSDESDTPDVTALAKNDLLTIDVDAANGAEDLTVCVRVKQTIS